MTAILLGHKPAFVWVTCCAIYLALTPWRHPYFNTPTFCALVSAGMLFAILLARKRLDEWTGIICTAALVHFASVAACLVTWIAESTSGFQRFLSHSDVATALGTIFLYPFFCYAVPVVLLVTTFSRILTRGTSVTSK